MDLSLTDEQRALRDRMARFAREELNGEVRERDRRAAFPLELWRRCGELGLQGLPVGREHGGLGLGPLETALALEGLGHGCRDGGLVFSVCAHLLACVVPVLEYGTEEQRSRWLPGLASGRLIAVNGMTEASGGSDAFAMSTTAAQEEDGSFRINGSKTFATNAPVADLAVIYALTDRERGAMGGVTAFVVETGTPGFSAGQSFEKMGLRTSPIGELVFDGLRVPAGAVLGGVGGGARVFARSMEWERICLAAVHVGTMERLLERSVEALRARGSARSRAARGTADAQRLADAKCRLEAARLLVYRAAWRLGRPGASAMDASLTKLHVSEALVRTAREAVELLGREDAHGEGDAERALRDALASTIYSGTSEAQRNLLARWMGL